MTWNHPTLVPQTLLPTGANTGAPYITALAGDTFVNVFANVELAYGAVGQGTGLFFDPNGAPGSYNATANTGSFGGCATGEANPKSASQPEMISEPCIGNYLIDPNSSGIEGQYAASSRGLNTTGPSQGQTTMFSILFDEPVANVAFQFYTMGVGAMGCVAYPSTSETVQAAEARLGLSDSDLCAASYGTLIQAYSPSGSLLEERFLHYTSEAIYQWTSIASTSPIGYVTISDTGVNESAGGTWNFTLGAIDSTSPEPGTMLTMALGLAVFAFAAKFHTDLERANQ
jgi:hypothetical protein